MFILFIVPSHFLYFAKKLSPIIRIMQIQIKPSYTISPTIIAKVRLIHYLRCNKYKHLVFGLALRI